MELYKKYRPKSLKTIIGQDGAVAALRGFFDADTLPHFTLLSGPSGCGKTTAARIMKTYLDCDDADFFEKNCADFKGIDSIREIRKTINIRPFAGPVRIYLIDEAHKLTTDAQEAILKMLEDTPSHAYFILCTTDPKKLKKAIHTRATEIVFHEVCRDELRELLNRVIDKEKLQIPSAVVHSIAEIAEASPRKALVLLDQIAHVEGEDAQLNALESTSHDKKAAESLARELIFGRGGWGKVCEILRSLQDQDAEGIRYQTLGYANSVMIGKTKGQPASGAVAGKCYKVLECFADNFYSSKMGGLTRACYEVSLM